MNHESLFRRLRFIEAALRHQTAKLHRITQELKTEVRFNRIGKNMERLKEKHFGRTEKNGRELKSPNQERLGAVLPKNRQHLKRRMKCEKCNNPTRYRVKIMGERWAAWCGCA